MSAFGVERTSKGKAHDVCGVHYVRSKLKDVWR